MLFVRDGPVGRGLSSTRSMTSGSSLNESDLCSDPIDLLLAVWNRGRETLGGRVCSGFAVVAVLDKPPELAGARGLNILAMSVSAIFFGAGLGLLEGNSCFSRAALACVRDGRFAATPFSRALPNIGRG